MVRRLPTPVAIESDGGMYESAAKIYPREIGGRFQRLRKAAVFWLLGMFYLFPWLQWNGRQAVLFDLPARKFYIFGLDFWPQDFIYLSLLLMMAAFALFFVTALAGRLWCGYACPQTVWTEVFLWLEQWTEGNRNQRMKLDAAPWSAHKLWRKGSKQFLWVTFALWTGFTFVGFFTPIRTLAQQAAAFSFGPWETFWTFFYGLATYGNAGYLREQVCKYMCPYARFQGAMFDRNTLVISYDTIRGEPRGPRRRGTPRRDGTGDLGLGTGEALAEASAHARASAVPSVQAASWPMTPLSRQSAPPESLVPSPESQPLGDCIACTICVQVCPTGIDIREGLQYECIACGACVDACDEVMDKMGYPRGLVRYTTQNAVEGKRVRLLRPRVLIYATILLCLMSGFAWSVTHRVPLIVDVLRDRNALYRVAGDGAIENAYTLKVMNKRDAAARFRIEVDGNDAIQLAGGKLEVDVAGGQVANVPVTLRAEAGAVKGKAAIAFEVESVADDDVKYHQKSSFFAPL